MKTAALLAMMTSCFGGEIISVPTYRDRLSSIRDHIAAGALEDARREALALGSCRVDFGNVELPVDAGVLNVISGAEDLASARAGAEALEMLIDALGRMSPEEAVSGDLALLARLRVDQQARDVKAGGEIALPEPEIPKSLLERLQDFLTWLLEKAAEFLRALWRLFLPESGSAEGEGIGRGTVILIISIAVLLAAASFFALRNRGSGKAGGIESVSVPVRSRGDEDPLSRSSLEWERHAAEMAASGRHREAVRAWYHAVLVTLFHSGLAHYRKDRTNWEYAFALEPEIAWRAEFLEATRTFESEWYGRRSTSAAVAGQFARGAQRLLSALRVEARS